MMKIEEYDVGNFFPPFCTTFVERGQNHVGVEERPIKIKLGIWS